jgi:hypothetical protein
MSILSSVSGMAAKGILGSPEKSANKYLNQVSPMAKQYYNPYIQAGLSALPQLQSNYSQLTSNPSGMFSNLGQGYQQSPGYQWQLGQAQQGANQAAAAGGMSGSPQAQQYGAQVSSDIANQDFYNYISQALGLYQTGLGGLSGLNQMGFQGSSNLVDLLSNLLGSQSELAYQQKREDIADLSSVFGAIGSSFF